MAEVAMWLGIGAVSAYLVGNKLLSSDEVSPEIIPPPPQQPYFSPSVIYARAGEPHDKFYTIIPGGVDNWGTPYSWGIGTNGTKIKLYGDDAYLKDTIVKDSKMKQRNKMTTNKPLVFNNPHDKQSNLRGLSIDNH
jgi:hypothetical protein